MKENIDRAITEPYIFDELLGETLRPAGLELTAHAATIASIKSGQRVLDIGCGRGSTAVFLAQKYSCHVTGIDLGESKIAFSQAKANYCNLSSQTQFLVADGECLPFRNGSFDIAISECTFSLMPNQGKTAEEIRRVLKPGGPVHPD